MSKVFIDQTQTAGALLATGVAKLQEAALLIARVQGMVSQSGDSTNLEGSTFGYGIGVGQGAAAASALGGIASDLATLMTNNAGRIQTLDQGNQ